MLLLEKHRFFIQVCDLLPLYGILSDFRIVSVTGFGLHDIARCINQARLLTSAVQPASLNAWPLKDFVLSI